jgi:hypothetical protein
MDDTMALLSERLAELTADLERCPAWKVGTRWWLDRLEGAAMIRRQMERIEAAAE